MPNIHELENLPPAEAPVSTLEALAHLLVEPLIPESGTAYEKALHTSIAIDKMVIGSVGRVLRELFSRWPTSGTGNGMFWA